MMVIFSLPEEGRCGDMAKECHSLAQCITKGGEEICECNVGYIGDGGSCQGEWKLKQSKSYRRNIQCGVLEDEGLNLSEKLTSKIVIVDWVVDCCTC
jgi:hypothetical protein